MALDDTDGAGAGTGLSADEQEFLDFLSGSKPEEPGAAPEGAGAEGGEPPAADGEEPPAEEDEGGTALPEGKANAAFAQMRVENTALRRERDAFKQTLDSLGGVMGIDPGLPDGQRMDAVKEKFIQYQSQKTGVPPELLTRLESLEEQNRSYQSKELELYNQEQFAGLKEKFSLTDEEVAAFQAELMKNGADWTQNKVLAHSAYRDWHFDEIVEKRISKAVGGEQERKEKVEEHSTTPGAPGAGGDKDDGGTKLSSVADLTEWLNSAT